MSPRGRKLLAILLILNVRIVRAAVTLSQSVLQSKNRYCRHDYTCKEVNADNRIAHEMCNPTTCETHSICKHRNEISMTMCNGPKFRDSLIHKCLNQLRSDYAKKLSIGNMNAVQYDVDDEFVAFCYSGYCRRESVQEWLGCYTPEPPGEYEAGPHWILYDVQERTYNVEFDDPDRLCLMMKGMFLNLPVLKSINLKWMGCARRAFHLKLDEGYTDFALICSARERIPKQYSVTESDGEKCAGCTENCNADFQMLCGGINTTLPSHHTSEEFKLEDDVQQAFDQSDDPACDKERHRPPNTTTTITTPSTTELSEEPVTTTQEPTTTKLICPTRPHYTTPEEPEWTISPEQEKNALDLTESFQAWFAVMQAAFSILDLNITAESDKRNRTQPENITLQEYIKYRRSKMCTLQVSVKLLLVVEFIYLLWTFS